MSINYVKKKCEVKVIDSIICDACGENCKAKMADVDDYEYATLSADWGYWSDSDGQSYRVHLCEECFYDILGHVKTKRLRSAK